MTTLRRALGAVLLSSLVLTGCSEEEPAASPVPPLPTSPGSPASTGIEDLSIPQSTVDPSDGSRPDVSAPVVAMQFQTRLYEGSRDACTLLTPEARRSIVGRQVDGGRLQPGSSCADYVELVASNYPGKTPEVNTYLVEETADSASVRVEMVTDSAAPTETTMVLDIVDGEWLVRDWGVH